jgi:hypothetical protein
MCTSDRGVSSAELRSHVEGGRAAAADDDVVCMGIVFAPTVLVAVHGSSSLYSRVWHETGSVRAILDLYVFSRPAAGGTRGAFV